MHSSVDHLNLSDLSDIDAETWARFQAADPVLSSPYFSLAYFKAVDKVRPGVKVMRFYDCGRISGYWPFRKGPFGTARPVAGTMDDLHGIIAHPKASADLNDPILRRHIGGYAFSAVPSQQRRHGLRGQYGSGNQVMDLSQGYDAWLEGRSADSSNFRREWRKAQKLLDTPHVTVHHDLIDQASFDRLIELKREAYHRAGHFDLFKLKWPRALLTELLKSSDDAARGVLSTLRIEGEIAAIAYCMRSTRALHYWFPAYEANFAKQKPGLALLFALAQWADQERLTELHLGLGDTQYKRQMASWMMPVRGGTLALAPPQQLATDFSKWGARIEGNNRLLDVPAKYTRKYERMALSGSWRA